MKTAAAERRPWTFPMTKSRKVLIAVSVVGIAAIAYRLVFGLGAATGLTDRWPWGLWVWWDVMTGVALAGGGYSTALLVHFLGHDRWKELERAAFLTSLLGYLMVCAGLFLDLGRWINVWKVAMVWNLNPHSVMTELFVCVTGYTVIQIVEFGHIFVERVNAPRLARVLHAIYAPVLIVGVLLPVLHQSSLGALYVIAAGRLDPLWWSMLLPLFFLMSSFFVGPAMVTTESFLSSKAHSRRPPVGALSEIVRVSGVLMAVYLALKLADLAFRGMLPSLIDGSIQSNLLMLEIVGGVMLPTFIFLRPERSPRALATAGALTVFGVALNRANVVFTGMAAQAAGATYRPSLIELTVTFGIVAVGILAYLFVVDNFAIYPPGQIAIEKRPSWLMTRVVFVPTRKPVPEAA